MLWNALPVSPTPRGKCGTTTANSTSTFSTWRSARRSCKAGADGRLHRHLARRAGDWIRDLTAAGQRRAISELLSSSPNAPGSYGMAWWKRSRQRVGKRRTVVVYPGEMISVDGEVDGLVTIDQKTITGEGLPVKRDGRDGVRRHRHGDGQITVRALGFGLATTAGQIVDLADPRDRRHPDAKSSRALCRSPGDADAGARRWYRRDNSRFNRFLSLVIVDYGPAFVSRRRPRCCRP